MASGMCSITIHALLLVSVTAAPPRDLVLPPLQFDIFNIKTPQLIGIIAGTVVFSITIAVVIYLLYASGTLGGAWKEIAGNLPVGGISLQGKSNTAQTRVETPFAAQPELYDHLLAARLTLPKQFTMIAAQGKYTFLRMLTPVDYQFLFEASNGSAQYHESAYPLVRIWGWQDVDFSGNEQEKDRRPWDSVEAFGRFLQDCEEEGKIHLVVEEKEYKKPIGLITLSNHSLRNLSVNIEHIWITPAFQGEQRAHEAVFLLLDYLFKSGYRRVTAEVEERNVIGRKFVQRCGFMFETTLRKHKVIQGRNSNTALYVVLNSEWQDLLPKMKKYQLPEPKKKTIFD